MPTYDYECTACRHKFEELQSFSEPVLTKCPKCKKNKLARLFGGGGAIIFKGGGFYETDYRRAGETNGEGKSDKVDQSDKAETKSEGGETKTEAKTEAKTETKADAAPAPKAEAKSDTKGGGKKAK